VIAVLIVAVLATGIVSGIAIGFKTAASRSRATLKVARYDDAIALMEDLVNNPDGADLRPRASKILAAHRAALADKESRTCSF
jgi:hypothetical protein